MRYVYVILTIDDVGFASVAVYDDEATATLQYAWLKDHGDMLSNIKLQKHTTDGNYVALLQSC